MTVPSEIRRVTVNVLLNGSPRNGTLDRSETYHTQLTDLSHRDHPKFNPTHAVIDSQSVVDGHPRSGTDPNLIANYNYGIIFRHNEARLVDALQRGRQAALGLQPTGFEDYTPQGTPCTSAISWQLRDGRVSCYVLMRSCDLWIGLPHDVENFRAMTRRLARHHQLGSLTILIASAHLYEKDLDDVYNWVSPVPVAA